MTSYPATSFHPDPELCPCGGSGWVPGPVEDEPCQYHAENACPHCGRRTGEGISHRACVEANRQGVD